MGFRQNLLKASPFQTYFIPALILFVIVGGSALIASMAVFRQHRLALKAAFMSGDYSHLAQRTGGHYWLRIIRRDKKQFQLTDTASYIGWAVPFIIYAILEEFGLRGFVLPYLQERFVHLHRQLSLHLSGCLALAVFPVQVSIQHRNINRIFLCMFVGAVILTSVFNFSKCSLLACIIFHLTNDIASAFDKNYIVAAVSTGLVILAVYLLLRYKPENLSDKERTKNYFKRCSR